MTVLQTNKLQPALNQFQNHNANTACVTLAFGSVRVKFFLHKKGKIEKLFCNNPIFSPKKCFR